MVLVRAWIKDELENVLHIGVNSPSVHSRRVRITRKQHVQCVEVDKTHSALKINDGETMVWCFVTRPGMHKFVHDRKNPKFASLNNMTITIDDWEFSLIGMLCPAFDERKAKGNGHICILINKFSLLGGERTTTIGNPSDLGEGNRDLRAIWRALYTPRDLLRALARGQGLVDLRDMDGVVMNAPESQSQGVNWEDVEPALMVNPETESPMPPPPASAEKYRIQQPSAGARTPPRGENSSGADDFRCRGPSTTSRRAGGAGGASRESASDDWSQQSLGMDYDGDFGGGEDEFQTQAPSAGNVFSQEEMDMRPASPTPPSPPSAGVGGGGNSGGGGLGEAADAAAPVQEVGEGDVDEEVVPRCPNVVPNAFDDVPPGTGGSVTSSRAQQARDGGGEGGGGGKGPTVRVKSLEGQVVRGNGGGVQEQGEEEEEESGTDPIPPGFTQLDVQSGDAALELPESQRQGAECEDDEEDEDEGELVGESRGGNGAASSRARAERVAGSGKGKGRVSFERPSLSHVEVDSMREATAGGSGGDGGGATEDSQSLDDNLSAQELSGGTASSSNAGTPNSNQLGLSCLTQKRQNEGPCYPNSGARAAAGKCDIRNVFRNDGGRGGGVNEANPLTRHFPRHFIIEGSRLAGGNRRGRVEGSGGGSSGSGYTSPLGSVGGGGGSEISTPYTVEMPIEDGLKSAAAEKAAKWLPARPLLGGSLQWRGRKRKRPLSDVLVAVDPAWSGQGPPPIVARGADADELLAEWLDTDWAKKRAPLSIGAWLDKYTGAGSDAGRCGGPGGGSGGGSGSADGGGAGGGSSAGGERRC